MLSLAQARRMRGAAGDPLPSPYKTFDDYGIVFRRGQLVLIVAGPGTGKSTIALNLALKTGVPTFYQSADSNAYTQISRAFSIVTGVSRDRADDYSLGAEDDLGDQLLDYPIRWSFGSSPTVDDINASLVGFAELYGEYPHLVIVDNLKNVVIDPTERSGLDSLTDYLNDVARETQACVIALHHVKGEYSKGLKPIPVDGILDQVHRVPEMILTAFRPSNQTIGFSKVKDRAGQYDPNGEWFAEMSFDVSTMRIEDMVSKSPFKKG